MRARPWVAWLVGSIVLAISAGTVLSGTVLAVTPASAVTVIDPVFVITPPGTADVEPDSDSCDC